MGHFDNARIPDYQQYFDFPTIVTLITLEFPLVDKTFRWVNDVDNLVHEGEVYTPKAFIVDTTSSTEQNPQVKVHFSSHKPENEDLWLHGGELLQEKRQTPIEVTLKEVFKPNPHIVAKELKLQITAMQYQDKQLTLVLGIPHHLQELSVTEIYRPERYPELFDGPDGEED